MTTAAEDKDLPPRRAWLLAILIAAALFAAVVPTLRWVEFTNGNENIVVQTALEMRHGGPKLLPHLLGEPRVKKPPLVAWIASATMRQTTIDQLKDNATSEAAYQDLAIQVRWPSLLAACVLVLATFDFGRTWGGARVGLCSAMAVATCYLTFKYMRQATTDAHLAAWVAIANACLARGLLRGGRWTAAIGGGVAVGVAFLCKGPVALVQTVLPALVTMVVLQLGREKQAQPRERDTQTLAAMIAGISIALLIAVPWFAYVIANVPDVFAVWKSEVTREGATNLEVSNPASYLLLGPLTAPWIVFGIIGLLALWQLRWVRAAWVPTVFAVVPLLVMVWFRDRKERYMLPMVMPACVICGYGAAAWVRSWTRERTRGDIAVLCVHGGLLLAAGIALVLLGATNALPWRLQRLEGGPWFERSLAIGAGAGIVVLAIVVAVFVRRRPWVAIAATFVAMLGATALYYSGYRFDRGGLAPLRPLADAIRRTAPDAPVYDWLPRGRADEQLAVYLDKTITRADPATLVYSDHPAVLICRQAKRRGELEPLPALSPRWRKIASAPEGSTVWSAFLLIPSPGTPGEG